MFASVAQLVEQRTENPRVVGSIPTGGTIFSPICRNRIHSVPTVGSRFPYAGVAHPVERHLAKVEVASSSLVTRSIKSPAKRLGFFSSGDEARTISSDSPVDCRALPAGRQCNHRSASGTRLRRLVTRSIKKSSQTAGLFPYQKNISRVGKALGR